MQFLQHHNISSLFVPNILLSTLFSNTLSQCSSLNVRGQISHPNKTASNFIILHILIFAFLDIRREDRRFRAEWKQAFPEFNLLDDISIWSLPFAQSFAIEYTDYSYQHPAPGGVYNPHCAAAYLVAYLVRHRTKQHSSEQVASSLKCNSVHMWKRKPIINIRIGIVLTFKNSRSRLDYSSGSVPGKLGRSAGSSKYS
jgi:hypothetical protein